MKRNSNVVAAILNNFDIAEKALVESQNAAGSALAENEKYLDSVNGKLNQLKASWEQLSTGLLNSTLLKDALSVLRTILDFFNNLNTATQGVSSTLLSLATAFVLVKSVMASFAFKAKDSTSVISAIVDAFSTKKLANVRLFSVVLTALKKKLMEIAATFTITSAASGSLAKSLAFAAAEAVPLIGILAGVGLALWGIPKIVSWWNENHPSLEDLQNNLEESKARADELKSSLDENNERLAELKTKLADGGLTFVEQDELDRLTEVTAQLQAQYDVAAKLAQIDAQKVADKVAQEVDDYFNSQDEYDAIADSFYNKTEYHQAQDALAAYKEAESKYNEEATKSNADTTKLRQYKKEMDEAYAIVSASEKKTQEWLVELNKSPKANAEGIKQANTWLDTIYLAIGGADALATIWNRFWGDDSARADVAKTRDELTKAAQAQSNYNEQLKQYGSTVDLTKRPRVEVTQDMADTGLWYQEDVGAYSTVNSQSFLAKDFGNKKSTQAILVTPILPDGTYFDSQEALEDYLASLIDKETGEFDASKDTKGIVMGIFDKGSVDASLDQAAKIAEGAHEVNAAFYDLLSTDVFQDFLDELKAAGYEVDNLTAGDLAAMFESLVQSVDPATESLKGLTEALSALEEKGDVIKDAQEDLASSGNISISTLSDIVEKFPALEESVSLYIAGMKTGKELIADLSAAYAKDTESYKKSMAQKLAASEEFYKSLPAKQQQLIRDIAASYKVDLGNFKTIEEAKLNFQAEIIKRLAANYKRYAGASLEDLKDYRANLRIALANAENSRVPGAYGKQWQASTRAELAEVEKTIKVLEDANSRYDSIINTALSDWSPSDYADNDKSSKSSSDAYKKAVQEKIDALKHQYALEKITAEQYYNGLEAIEKKYYKDSKAHMTKYASEIRSIDEELFNGRRELAEDWLNDQEKLADKAAAGGSFAKQEKLLEGMMAKVKKMMADAYAYGLTEASDYVQELQDKLSSLQDSLLSAVQSPYEKYISYMDDFDLWDDVALTGDAFISMAASMGLASDTLKKLDKQLRGLSKLDALKEQLKEIDQLYKDGKLSWGKYVSAHNSVAKNIYDTQKDSLQTILDLTMEMIKQEAEDQVDAIEKQVDAYQKIIDLKKQLLQDTADEEDHEEQVAEKVKEIAELQSKIAQLSLDDSREAAAKRASLAEELQQKQKELADLQKDYALDQTIDALDKSQEAFEDEKDAEKKAVEESVDSWAKLYEKAIKRIDGDWDSLYNDLMEYQKIHRDSIDGPNSLVTAWQNATSAMKEYNNSFEDAYNGAPNYGLNPNASQSEAAQAILKQMQANSALAKSMGTTKVGGRDLHKENEELAEQYYQLTGQRLVYNNGWRLDYDQGSPAYDIPSTSNGGSTQPKDTASGGEAYKATVAKFNSPPSGTLKEGSSGEGVKWLQYYLKQLGFFNYAVDGYFYFRTKDALKRFQAMAKLSQDGIYGPKTRAALPNYHTGGIVGNAGAINDTEVLALLKKGEWVLDDQRKQNLKAMFSNLKMAAAGMMGSSAMARMQTMRPAMAGASGDTFAPSIQVTINHSGAMTDKDAKSYGNKIADTAIARMNAAFVKRGKT